MINKYKKKPVVIEALQWTGENKQEIIDFAHQKAVFKIKRIVGGLDHVTELVIATIEGNMRARIGDYIIKGVEGEFYPCKKEIFESTYEIVEG